MSHDEDDQPIAWLSSHNIEDGAEASESIMGIEGMLGSGQMVGGIVNERAEQEEVRCIVGMQGMLGSGQMQCIVGMQGMFGSGQMHCGNAGNVWKWSDGRRDCQWES